LVPAEVALALGAALAAAGRLGATGFAVEVEAWLLSDDVAAVAAATTDPLEISVPEDSAEVVDESVAMVLLVVAADVAEPNGPKVVAKSSLFDISSDSSATQPSSISAAIRVIDGPRLGCAGARAKVAPPADAVS